MVDDRPLSRQLVVGVLAVVVDAHARGHDLVARAPGEAGEIGIRGPVLVPGYWNAPEATREAFPDGYWLSGDVGSVDAEGWARLLDRKKDLVNRGGYAVYSIAVEPGRPA